MTAGSTVVAFRAGYLNSLSNGVYDIKVNFTDGYADTQLTVAKANTRSPKTGDDPQPITSWPVLAAPMIVGMGGFCASIYLRAKKSKNK